MKKSLIAGNWKMYKTPGESVDFLKKLAMETMKYNDREVLVCPPFTSLYPAAEILKDAPVSLGAQNVHTEKEGAFTGEISPAMLRDSGVEYVICGHSERRNIFGENDSTVNGKVRISSEYGMSPILCVGEKIEERKAGKTFDVIRSQVENGLSGYDRPDMLVVAYEPVWAIGTGLTATPEQAQEVHLFIRQMLSNLYGRELSMAVRILYGGSVKPENVNSLMRQDDIDGALVGGASLKLDSFMGIVNYS